jgi:hypothetical protein
MSTREAEYVTQDPLWLSNLPPWRKACLLCSAGLRDQTLINLVAELPFSSPCDPEIAAVAERGSEFCVLALDENLFWCRIAQSQADRILRLLKSGELALRVHAFQPNGPEVLTGARAQLLSIDAASLTGLAIARRQPAAGFTTPHHVRASLRLGPNANVTNIRRLAANLRSATGPPHNGGK